MEKEYRLTPQMASRKLQVVSFVQQYIARWGAWPSYGEIGSAMGIASSTARDAVRRAVRDKLLHREKGARKPAITAAGKPRLSISEAAELLDRLRAAGIVIATPAGIVADAVDSKTHTFCPLPISPPFRHIPDIE